MTSQSYLAVPRRHTAAVTLAVFPAVAYLVAIFLSQVYNGALMSSALDADAAQRATGLVNAAFVQTCAVMVMLANGFVVTAMLWGGAAAFLIDRRAGAAAALLGTGAVLSLFGLMHSILPTGGVYLPWTLASRYPYQWAIAYAGLAITVVALGRTRAFRESPAYVAD